MPFTDAVRVIQTGSRRLKIFVDFWNVVISARQQTKKFEIEVKWNVLADQMVSETRQDYHDETPGTLAGCYIFGSYSRSDPKQNEFIDRTLDGYGSLPGLFFSFSERVKKETSLKCSKCGHLNSQIAESGVDVILTVEMIKHAAMREHEYLALISSDRDFIPLLSYLKDQGQRVLHGATEEPNREMRSLTWKQIDLKPTYQHSCAIRSDDKYFIFTAPFLDGMTNQAKMIFDSQGKKYKVFDLTDADAMPEKDMKFVLGNLNIFFQQKGANPNLSFAYHKLCGSIYDLRIALRAGTVFGMNLPYIMHEGSLYAHRGNERSRWFVSPNVDTMEPWQKPVPPSPSP